MRMAFSQKAAASNSGLREFETQILDGAGTFLNFADVDGLGTDASLFDTLRPNFVGAFNIDSVSADVNLGILHTGDTLSYVYTLTAEELRTALNRAMMPSSATHLGRKLSPTTWASQSRLRTRPRPNLTHPRFYCSGS